MQETRLSYVDIQYAGSSGRCIQATDSVLFLDHATFTNVNVQYLTLDNSSFQVRSSVFPSLSGAELNHGAGLPTGGYGLIEGNTFGTTTGLNDIIDFFSMPKEVEGVVPTNSESTLTYIQALRVYLRYKFGVSYPSGSWLLTTLLF